jgi:thiol-disulfide isomerase/thioredoxin
MRSLLSGTMIRHGISAASVAMLAAFALLPCSLMAKRVPDPAFKTLDGKTHKVSSLRGQIVVVNFWATWCGPCKEEMPSLAALSKDYTGRGVKVIAISVDRLEDGAAAKAFLKSHGGLQFYNDPEYRVVFGLTPRPDGIPTTVIYDKTGKEQARLSGGADWSTDQARKVMDAVLARG